MARTWPGEGFANELGVEQGVGGFGPAMPVSNDEGSDDARGGREAPREAGAMLGEPSVSSACCRGSGIRIQLGRIPQDLPRPAGMQVPGWDNSGVRTGEPGDFSGNGR